MAANDVITDLALDWLRRRDRGRPFFLMLHHKAPHRPWEPDDKHARMYEDVEVPYPETFDDDYATRSQAAHVARMRMDDLNERDTKGSPPEGLSPAAARRLSKGPACSTPAQQVPAARLHRVR